MNSQILCQNCSFPIKRKGNKFCSRKCYFEHDKERLRELAVRVGKESSEKISQTRLKGFADGSIVHPFLGKKLPKEHIENMIKARVENGTFAR